MVVTSQVKRIQASPQSSAEQLNFLGTVYGTVLSLQLPEYLRTKTRHCF